MAAKSMTSLFNLNNLKNSLAIIETEKKFFQEKGIYEIIVNTINSYKPSGVFITNLYFAPEDKDHFEPLVLGLVDFTTSNPDFCYVPPKSRWPMMMQHLISLFPEGIDLDNQPLIKVELTGQESFFVKFLLSTTLEK